MSSIKIILLSDTPGAVKEAVSNYCDCKVSEIDFIELRSMPRREFLKRWLFERSDICAIYTDRLVHQKKHRLWILLLCLGNAPEKLIVEASGEITKIPAFKTFCIDLFTLFLELLATLILWCAFVVFLPAYKIYIRSQQQRTITLEGKKVAVFLRTNFWFGLKFGGSVSHIKGFTGALQSLGYSVEFVSSDGLENMDSSINIVKPTSFFTYSPTLAKLIYNFTFMLGAVKVIKKARPQFLYHRHDELTFSSVLLARHFYIPLILEFNSSEVWKKRHWGRKKRVWLYNQCEEIALHGADHIVTVSETNKDNLSKWYKVRKDKVTVNPNGVDPRIFKPDNELRNTYRRKLGVMEKTVVGFIGSFGVWHGVEVLSSVMAEVIKADPTLHFLWVGDGPYIKYVWEHIHEDNLDGSVTVTGAVSYDQIPGYLNACDMLVSPHNPQVDGADFFGSPTKLFEYMAVGKGIVASDLGQIGSVLEHMRDAILVSPGRKDELTKGILALSRDPHLRDRLGKNARMKALQTYTWGTNARRVLSAVGSLEGQ